MAVPLATSHQSKVYNRSTLGLAAFNFNIFLGLLLVLFLARMVTEFVSLVRWFEVMLGCPNWHRPGEESCVAGLERVGICTRLAFSLVLLVQLVVAFLTLIYGLVYLLGSNGYMDAIWNTLALVFVIGIDDVLYAGLYFKDAKVYMSRIKVLNTRKMPKWVWCLLYTILIGGVTLTCVALAFHEWFLSKHQAKQVACLCQMEGEGCLGARLWQNPVLGTEPLKAVQDQSFGCTPPINSDTIWDTLNFIYSHV